MKKQYMNPVMLMIEVDMEIDTVTASNTFIGNQDSGDGEVVDLGDLSL